MLPEVTLRDVSRDDVDRIAWWLDVEEVSSRWFGHYGCGDPIHRGYDSRHMLEASGLEWESVFSDPHRLIYSIFNEREEHIGECQVILDNEGGAELSLLIGRKDLWHRGYGTSTVMALLDKTFEELELDSTWVNVPEDNGPALGLFEKLGFVTQATKELCKRRDGVAINTRILTMDSDRYHVRHPLPSESRPSQAAVVTISGLPGSGTEAVGTAIAGRMGYRFLDEEISEAVCARLRRTPGEAESLEAGFKSFWTRLLETVVLPMEWSAAYDASYHWYRADSALDHDLRDESLTREQYVKGLASVVKTLAVQGKVVLNGRGSHLFASDSGAALHVFVAGSPETRWRRVAELERLTSDEAAKELKRLDRQTQSVFRGLFRTEMLDTGRYDLTVNLDRMSADAAADLVAGALEGAAAVARNADAETSRATLVG